MWKILSFFAQFYTPGRFIMFIRTAGRKVKFLPKILTIFYCMQDKDTPKFIKLALMGLLAMSSCPLIWCRTSLPDLAGWTMPLSLLQPCTWPGLMSNRNTGKRYAACSRS